MFEGLTNRLVPLKQLVQSNEEGPTHVLQE